MSDPSPSAFSPLAHRTFAVLWIATVVNNIGGWMTDTASGWLMTSLSPSPLTVALVQVATTLPMFLLALPAGALADLLDRRKVMIAIQVCLGFTSVALGVLTTMGLINPQWLLILTFLAGVGSALLAPMWQAVVPDLIPRELLRPAIALNGIAVNIARVIGPIAGSLLIVNLGTAAPYFADVVSYALIVVALCWWRRVHVEAPVPEHFAGALRAGLRYVRYSADLQRVFLRAAGFFVAASCYWALLPLLARQEFGAGAPGYGLLLAALGAGAIIGALILPQARRLAGPNGIVVGGCLVTAAVLAALAYARSVPVGAVLLFPAGVVWIAVLTTLNAAVQSLLPDWVRGRGISIYLMVVFGSLTIGSILWGRIATATTIHTTLLIAGAFGAVTALLMIGVKVPETERVVTPSKHWPELPHLDDVKVDGGPVMVNVEYRVALERQAEFREVIRHLGVIRRRDGAFDWGVVFDIEQPERVIEWFLVGSWNEHLRQHGRVTVGDRDLEERVRAVVSGPVKITHFLDLSARLRGR